MQCCRAGYRPLYLRQTANDITGEHTTIMIQGLDCTGMEEAPTTGWVSSLTRDFGRRLSALLSYRFRTFNPLLAYQLLTCAMSLEDSTEGGRYKPVSESDLRVMFIDSDFKRLDAYARHMVDHHMVTDLIPRVATLYVIFCFLYTK